MFPKVINVGCENITIQNYCERVIDKLQFHNKKNLLKMADSNDISSSSMIDDSLFRNKFGWSNQFNIEDIIIEFYNKIKQ